MKNIKVELIEYSSEKPIFRAIAKPYRNENPSIDLIKKICVDKNYEEKHGSVLEHVWMSFDIKNVSHGIFLNENSRHRHASPTVESTRFSLKKVLKEYGDVAAYESDPWAQDMSIAEKHAIEKTFVIPDKQILLDYGYTEEQAETYIKELIIFNNYSMMTLMDMKDNVGVKHNDLLKYFINENYRTSLVWTINLRSLRNFLKLRTSEGAHFEIRYVATLIELLVRETWIGELL